MQVQDNDIWLGKQRMIWLGEMHDTLHRAGRVYKLAMYMAEESELGEELKSYSTQITHSSNKGKYLQWKTYIFKDR